MDFLVLGRQDQGELLRQRLFMHEKAIFEAQVQILELQELLPTLQSTSFDQAQSNIQVLSLQIAELETRMLPIRRMMGVEEPKKQDDDEDPYPSIEP